MLIFGALTIDCWLHAH